jgi:SAM-dependent methyltransferase
MDMLPYSLFLIIGVCMTSATEMRICHDDVGPVTDESEVIDELLRLKGAAVLDLGCGKGDKTRLVAQKAASVLGLEVDEAQLAKNKASTGLPNVRFERGGAERILAAEGEFDAVLMFKSLHHVPIDLMDAALEEIRRVLKPGGVAYISEPIYAGDFNEILRLFHDERAVREAAFAAEQRAVGAGLLSLIQQKFFLQPMHFDNFGDFEDQVLNVTHSDRRLSPDTLEEVRARFEQHMTPNGVTFCMPMRVDLLGRP